MVALGAARLWKALSDWGANVVLIRLPYFHPDDSCLEKGILWRQQDQGPDDFIVRNGAEQFRTLMDQARSADPHQMMQVALEGADPSERPGRVAALTRDTYFQAALIAGGKATMSAVAGLTKQRAGLGKRDLQELTSAFQERIRRRGTEQEPSWKEELVTTASGQPRAVGQNVELALRHDPGLRGLVAFDGLHSRSCTRELHLGQSSTTRARTRQEKRGSPRILPDSYTTSVACTRLSTCRKRRPMLLLSL